MTRYAAAIGRTASQRSPDDDRLHSPVTRPARADRADTLLHEARWLDANDRPVVGVESAVEGGAFLLRGVYRQGGATDSWRISENSSCEHHPDTHTRNGEMEFGPVEDGEMRIEVMDIDVATLPSATPEPRVYGVVLSTRVNREADPHMVAVRPGRKGRVSADGSGMRGKGAARHEGGSIVRDDVRTRIRFPGRRRQGRASSARRDGSYSCH